MTTKVFPPALPFLYNHPRLHKTAKTVVFQWDSLLCAETVGARVGHLSPVQCQWPSQECILSVGLGRSQPCGLPMSPRHLDRKETKFFSTPKKQKRLHFAPTLAVHVEVV